MIKQIIKIIWIVVAIAVFAHYVYLRILVDYYDYDPFMIGIDFTRNAMIANILTFPISSILGFIVFIMLPPIDGFIAKIIFEFIILMSGYVQWFIFAPWIWKKLGSKTIKGNNCNE